MTDPDATPYRTTFDWREDSPAMAVVEAVAKTTGLEPTAFGLAEYVDPDALDALFRPRPTGAPRVSGRVEFTVEGRRVVVRATGEIAVFPGDADGDVESNENDDESAADSD